MKRFAFRLERIQRIRFLARREAEHALAQALAQARSIRADADLLAQRADAAARELMERVDRGDCIDGSLIRQNGSEVHALRAAVSRRRGTLAQAMEQVAICERVYAERNRGYKVLEKLHDKRKREWTIDVEREEQRILDELHLATVGERSETKRVS